VYYQCAGSFAALVCYLALCDNKEANKADVQRLLKLDKPEEFETIANFCDAIRSSGASPKLMMVMLALDRLGKSYKVHSMVCDLTARGGVCTLCSDVLTLPYVHYGTHRAGGACLAGAWQRER
jgi:hypothetical protein